MHTTSENDDFALPSRRILDNHGWLRTCKFRQNPSYRASENKDTTVAGTIEKPRILALRCFDAIFSGDKNATVRLSNGAAVKVQRKFKNNLRCIETENYRFVEQNPWKKGSKWARFAQQGHQIMWVIEKKTNKFLARVEERGVFKL
jgi:hypothetical protein